MTDPSGLWPSNERRPHHNPSKTFENFRAGREMSDDDEGYLGAAQTNAQRSIALPPISSLLPDPAEARTSLSYAARHAGTPSSSPKPRDDHERCRGGHPTTSFHFVRRDDPYSPPSNALLASNLLLSSPRTLAPFKRSATDTPDHFASSEFPQSIRLRSMSPSDMSAVSQLQQRSQAAPSNLPPSRKLAENSRRSGSASEDEDELMDDAPGASRIRESSRDLSQGPSFVHQAPILTPSSSSSSTASGSNQPGRPWNPESSGSVTDAQLYASTSQRLAKQSPKPTYSSNSPYSYRQDILSTPKPLDADQAAFKRLQNTIAARKSRERKIQHVNQLEQRVEELKKERDALQERSSRLEERVTIMEEIIYPGRETRRIDTVIR